MEFYDEEENVAHLQFGDEFFATKIDSLTNEEVYCLLKQNDGPNKVNTEYVIYVNIYIVHPVADTVHLLALNAWMSRTRISSTQTINKD